MNDAPVMPELKKPQPKKVTKSKVKPVAKKKHPIKRRVIEKPVRRPFPYQKVAELWEKGRTLTEISKAVGCFNSKSDDPNHRLRVGLSAMHRGWKDAKGKVHKLRYRVSKKAVKAATRAGKKAVRG